MSLSTRQTGWWLWSYNPVSLILWPFSLLFCLLVKIRFQLYRWQLLKSEKLPIPVIVVGNISLGGNGKTPFVVSLVKFLQRHNYNPAILTRGYKSDHEQETTILSQGLISNRAGDEANMLSELCACPVGVGANRVSSATALIEQFPQINILVTDDGLQHYALQRDLEIIVQRKAAYGNGFCLPAGPLREARSRLQNSDLVVDRDGHDLSETLTSCWNLNHPEQVCELTDFKQQKVNALAGIGFPELFFELLRKYGLQVNGRSFRDHETFTRQDLLEFKDAPLLVTHKDAVKLRPFATDNIWVVPLELILSDDLQCRLLTLIELKLNG